MSAKDAWIQDWRIHFEDRVFAIFLFQLNTAQQRRDEIPFKQSHVGGITQTEGNTMTYRVFSENNLEMVSCLPKGYFDVLIIEIEQANF